MAKSKKNSKARKYLNLLQLKVNQQNVYILFSIIISGIIKIINLVN